MDHWGQMRMIPIFRLFVVRRKALTKSRKVTPFLFPLYLRSGNKKVTARKVDWKAVVA